MRVRDQRERSSVIDDVMRRIQLIGERITDCVLTYLRLTIRLGLGQMKES